MNFESKNTNSFEVEKIGSGLPNLSIEQVGYFVDWESKTDKEKEKVSH